MWSSRGIRRCSIFMSHRSFILPTFAPPVADAQRGKREKRKQEVETVTGWGDGWWLNETDDCVAGLRL